MILFPPKVIEEFLKHPEVSEKRLKELFLHKRGKFLEEKARLWQLENLKKMLKM